MDRRDFIKAAALSAAAVGLLPSCKSSSQPASVGRVLAGESGISLLGYGGMRWPKLEGGDEIDQEAVNELVDLAISKGVNYFDTAPMYHGGRSETAMSVALNRHPREEWILATKLSTFKGPFTLDNARAMYENSLNTFKTDYIDYYLFHSVKGLENFQERFEADGIAEYFLRERELGHIRNLGFSFHGDKAGFDSMMELHSKYRWDFVQIQMNYFDWKHPSRGCEAEYMYGRLRELGIPVIIMEPLLGGQLANLPAAAADMLKSREPDRSLASWAFRFCTSFPGVLTVLSGMSCEEHLLDNVVTFSNPEPLSEDELAVLESIAASVSKMPLLRCTGCNYCMPCPFGIDIPGIFRFYNKEIKDGTYVMGPEQKDFAKSRRKFLERYAASVNPERQADHCISCNHCVRKCPQHISIPQELRRIDDYLEEIRSI